MAVNKVNFGGNTLIDLTGDTLESAEQLLKGIIAHANDGSVITGLMEAGGGGGIPGYNIISGTYTPVTDITSSFAVYKTESLAKTSSQIHRILNACTAFSFPVIAGLDDAISTFPCALLNAYSCSKGASHNATSSSSGSSSTITYCLGSSKISTTKYGLSVSLACNSSYPLRAGRTYQLALLIPEYIQIQSLGGV